MANYGITPPERRRRRPRRDAPRWPLAAGLLILLAVAVAVGLLVWLRRPAAEDAGLRPALQRAKPLAPTSELARMVFPTDQKGLLGPLEEGVFQPTGSGRPESGLYGSVRTASTGLARLHEGIDIAPTQRDRRGQPLDSVYAVADGRVGYVNRVSGNSSYGNYVVLLHRDPVGDVYTLYAHLAKVATGLAAGARVRAGDVLGLMGNTPSGMKFEPHLHLEIGLISNARFAHWFRSQKMTPDHGIYNGQNLLAIDPLAVLREQRGCEGSFTMLAHLATIPVAYELVLPVRKLPDFFARHPKLWSGMPWLGGPIVVSCSEAGVPLRGRCASEEETRLVAAGPNAVAVQNVDVAALGRNGRHIVVNGSKGWRLGERSGRLWVEVFRY